LSSSSGTWDNEVGDVQNAHPTALPSWPPLALIGGALHQLEDELMADFPLEDLMSTQEQAFSLSDFLEDDLFDQGNAAIMPERQSFPFAAIDVEHL
jgi:hypothetical protein